MLLYLRKKRFSKSWICNYYRLAKECAYLSSAYVKYVAKLRNIRKSKVASLGCIGVTYEEMNM